MTTENQTPGENQASAIPAFLHNLLHWSFSHAEGTAKGEVDDAKVEANPIVQVAVQAAVNAGQSILLNHVGKVMNVTPTPAGIIGALTTVVDKSAEVPSEAKEPLKLLLGGFLTGKDFLSAPVISSPVIANKAPAVPENNPGQGTLGSAAVDPKEPAEQKESAQ